MTGDRLSLRPVDRPDLDYVEALLSRNDLPTADVRRNVDAFFVAYSAGDRVGVGGIERYGRDGLLRSVVVEADRRGEGLGTDLCNALEARAAADGVETLYLLTTTAAEFFADRGYEAVDRSDAPEGIRDSAEFAELCPDSAVAMRKRV